MNSPHFMKLDTPNQIEANLEVFLELINKRHSLHFVTEGHICTKQDGFDVAFAGLHPTMSLILIEEQLGTVILQMLNNYISMDLIMKRIAFKCPSCGKK